MGRTGKCYYYFSLHYLVFFLSIQSYLDFSLFSPLYCPKSCRLSGVFHRVLFPRCSIPSAGIPFPQPTPLFDNSQPSPLSPFLPSFRSFLSSSLPATYMYVYHFHKRLFSCFCRILFYLL